MKHISFLLVGNKVKPSLLFGAIEVLNVANRFLQEKGLPPYYQIELVGEAFEQPVSNAFFSFHNLKRTVDIKRTDCVIIPATEPEEDLGIKYAGSLAWVVDQYHQGAEVASLCTGAFLLAATGLLEGKTCATHWKMEGVFKRMFPHLHLSPDKIITDHKGVYTAGGGMSSFNLCLYLVEKYNGREAALFCAKMMQLDIERQSQAPFQIFQGFKSHADEVIRNIQDFIENNVEQKITVDILASKCHMDRVNFSRRFKKATQLPPIDYIQQVKIEAAKRALERGCQNINEVMYAVGYIDIKAFRAAFKKIAGLSPTDYKIRFSHLGE